MQNKALIEEQIRELKYNNYSCKNCYNNSPSKFTSCFNIKIKIDYNSIKSSNWTKVCIPKDYPKSSPIVFDADKVIPRESDYHTSKDGELCLEHPINIYFKSQTNKTLLFFIEQFVEPFYYAFHYKKEHNKSPFGEYSHGDKGHMEAIAEFFKIEKISNVYYLSKVFHDKKNELLSFMPEKEVTKIEEYIKIEITKIKKSNKNFKKSLLGNSIEINNTIICIPNKLIKAYKCFLNLKDFKL